MLTISSDNNEIELNTYSARNLIANLPTYKQSTLFTFIILCMILMLCRSSRSYVENFKNCVVSFVIQKYGHNQ